jgi:LysM repeat protein
VSRQPVQKLKGIAIIGLSSVILLSGCSNPLVGSGDATPEAASPDATATTAPPMPIITPTPVDPAAVEAAANQTPGSGERPDTYVVAENDTLYAIAAQFEVDIARLVEENGLADPNDIEVGQELIIPPAE